MFRDFPQDFRYVLGLQEAVVVGMADGYAQATRNAAFVNLHSAAGVGNAMGNIFTAFRNRTPIVITAGQQARSILPFDPFLSSTQATELAEALCEMEHRTGARARRAAGDRARLSRRDAGSRAARCWCRFPSTTGTNRPSRCRHALSAQRLGRSRSCWRRSATRSMPAIVRRSSWAPRSTGTTRGTRSCVWPKRTTPACWRADVGPLQLSGRPPAVRRLPACNARADRRIARRP